ncbi:hypothetical protein EIB18_16275 [Caulobacter vibrioides]|uniref:hypothetical protein n=1 Tax=Caulobacter vibrioides TaxID=155892 RepID=UPI000BB473AC|nr:hypothetical protein [Caulobacter vibrioides]ATC25960.1 hypothetical protein CA608_16185 [Caulobacter vibrioides]AZH14100.1 hypothetical protein EIB18_16275 [Caulobacter vibrioides]PLR16399.1 hypothetical protein CVUC_00840 [Caulobacter vibrioides]
MSFQSRSVMLALSLAGLAALSGCDKLPGAAKPPTEAAKPVAPATSAAAPEPPPFNIYAKRDEERLGEAELLKELGQPNARNGQTLTLKFNGANALVVTDDDETYSLLTNVFQLPTDNGVQTVYEVTTDYLSASGGPFITLYDRRGVEIETVPRGLWRGAVLVITGQDEIWDPEDDARARTTLLDWSSKPHRKFEFKSRCMTESWVSDTEIKGYCVRPASQEANPGMELNGGDEVTDAVFTRVGPNAWRVRELSAPKAKLLNLPDNPPTAYDETVKGVPYSGNP